MIKNWFKNRLIPEKQQTPFWPSFAEAIQELYESEVETLLNRIASRRSLFSMSKEDLDIRTAEYGRFFVMGEVEDSQKAMLLTQRLDEIHFKGTTRPIEQTFWREFGNLPVTWQPLYAPVNTAKYPYGSYLINEDAIPVAKTTYGEFFLTSRGNIQVDLNALYASYGLGDRDKIIQDLLDKFDLIIAPLLPLHTVFDGVSLRLAFRLSAEADRLRFAQQVVKIAGMKWTAKPDGISPPGPAAKTGAALYRAEKEMTEQHLSFDAVPLDAWIVDGSPVSTLVSP